MVLFDLCFYLFAGLAVLSGAMVVTSRSMVHAVLFLILAFVNGAGLFLLTGAEFVALILVVVYVGAVAVLFLFVVMMLDIDVREERKRADGFILMGTLVAGIFAAELAIVLLGWQELEAGGRDRLLEPFSTGQVSGDSVSTGTGVFNIKALGAILYTRYFWIFQLMGLVLLVAMLGAILLTHRTREGVKRQNIARQTHRDARKTVRLVDFESER